MRYLILLAWTATAMFAQRGLIGVDRAPADKVADHIGAALSALAQHPGAVEAPERHGPGRVEYDLPLDEAPAITPTPGATGGNSRPGRQRLAITGPAVAYKDAAGAWKPVHPVLSKIPSGWDLTGTGVEVLVRPSGNATILGQYYVDPDTGVQDWLELDFPKVNYQAGMQFSYTHGSLPWTLLVDERGYTFESGPISTRGNRTFSYPYGSSRPLTVDADGGVTSTAPLRISRAVMVGADAVRYPCAAWAVGTTSLSFACNDAALPAAALPYRIDPSTTVTVYKSAFGTMSGVRNSLTNLRWSGFTGMAAIQFANQLNEEGFPVAWEESQPVIRFATPYPAGSVTSASFTLVRGSTFTNPSGCSLNAGYVDDRAFSDANLSYFWTTTSNPITTAAQAFSAGDIYGAYDYGALTSKTFAMQHLGMFGTSSTTIRMYLSCYDPWGAPSYYHSVNFTASTSMSVTYNANATPTTVSVSGIPANVPYGAWFNLAARVGDADGHANINYWHLLMNYGVDGSYACYFLFNHRTNTIQLNNDAGGNWGPAYVMGTANFLTNSQCQVDVANSNFTYPNSTDVTANLRLMFRPNAITRNPINAYLWAQDLNGAIANWSGPHATTTVVAPLTISTTALPGGIVGSSYSQTLAAAGGIPGYLWSIASGSLPSGLSLGSNGTISGTPTAAGTASFTVRATDSMTPTPQTATQNLTISVVSALSITTSALSGGTAGTAYSQTLNATGGTPGYTWSLASGSLPSGLSLAANGAISGTPTGSGTWNFTVLATDSTSPTPQTTTKALAITIVSALSISTVSLPNGQVSSAYSQALSASGGTAPYGWAIIGGALPVGLTLNAGSGAITGTPTTAGTSSVTFRATDSTSPTAQIADRGLSITIAPPPPPPAASLSGPGNGATGQALVPTLVWAPVTGATGYDVYLGASNPPAPAASNVAGTSYTPGSTLGTSTLYYWKVVAKNSGGSSPDSATWSFTTVPPPPPAVSLATPANGATAQALSPTLEWSGVAEATSYDVYLGTSNPPALAAANVVGTSYTPSPALGTSAVYYWKVVAKNSGGSSPDSATWSFTTVPPAPAAVSLSAPANGATAQPVSPTLTWAAAAGATSYDMYLGSSNPPALVASNISGTSYTPGTALSSETLYYWKVVAKNPGGASPDSATWTFTTVPPPPSAVSLAAPTDVATHQLLSPTLTWSPAAGATAYDLYLGTSNPPSLIASNLGGTSYTASSLSAGTAYFWKVVAKNAGGTAPDSAIWSFTTGTPPQAVTLSGPTNSATDQALSPTLTWMPAVGATSYDVYLGASNPPALLASNVAGNSYVPPSALTPETAYSWKIVARNSDGASPDSAVWSFSTVPAPPPAVSLLAPANGATAQPPVPTLTWAAAARATSYDVYLGMANPPVLVASNVAGTNYVPNPALNTGNTYYWKVVAKNTGGSSPDSAIWSFTVAVPPSVVTLSAPANGAAAQPIAATLSWAATAGATSYDVYLGTSSQPALVASDVTGTGHVPSSSLNAGTQYFWKVVAKNAAGSSPDSAIWSFTTASPPAAVTLSAPSEGASGQAVSTTLVWAASPGATSYDVHLGTTNPPPLAASNVTVTSYVPSPALNAGALYYWKVVAKNAGGSSPDSAVWSFGTASMPPTVTLSTPANGATAQPISATLTWSVASGATSYDVYLGTTNPPTLVASGVTGTSYVPTPALNPGVVHYWKVVAKSAGGSSPDSATWSFTTATPPAAVALSAPANEAPAQPVSTSLTWTPASGATSYDVYLATSTPPALVAANVTGTSYVPTIALAAGTIYYWKVVAKNGGGSTDSPVWWFATAPPSAVTVTTAPMTGLSMTVDGTNCTSPCTFQWAPGSSHTIGTTATQTATGTQHLFSNWSDGGAISHTISVSGATYTANFTTQHYLTTAVGTNIITGAIVGTPGTISPSSGWRNNNESVSVSAAASAGLQFTGFSGSLTGTTTPRTLTMSEPRSVTAIFGKSSLITNPTSGAGPTTFSVRYTNPNGVNTLNQTSLLVSWSELGTGACYVMYRPYEDWILLLADDGSQWLGFQAPGTPGYSLSNSQCTLNGAASSVTNDGTALTVNVSITFKPAFKGTRNVYAYSNSTTGDYAGELISTYQAYSGPVVTFNPSFGTVSNAGGQGSTAMQISDGGAWTAALSQPWLHLTSAASGYGNSTITYSADANPTTGVRSGSITVNGFPFWIDQTPAPLFVVGGTISDGTTGVPGVTVTLGGSQSTTTMTDNYGAYLFNVAPGSYTLTPSHPSYSFAPTTTPYSTASGDLTAANFTATPVVLTISGRVSKDSIGLPGVTLTLGGSESGTATTNASGDYTFTVHYGRSYTVTPAHSGDTFSPALANFTQITTNQTMNFTASSIVYTISGNVTGAPTCVSGVTVNLTGSSTGGKTATTNASGSYAFSSVAPGDTYTVHPVKAGCSFSPGSLPFANLSGNQTANFTATAAPMVTITGRITNGSAGLPNITVNLSGSETTSKITGADGSYTFTVGVGGSYTVTPKSDDHSFEPTFRTFDSVSANQTADFSASPLYRISGRITNSSGAGVEGTTLNLGGTKTESRATDTNGNYSFISLPPGNYTVTPSRDGFTFTPEPRVYNNLSQNQTAADFTATATATFTISGRITLGGAGVIGVTVNLSSGTQTKSTTTGENGSYTFNGIAPATYTVRPANWATSPGSITLTDVNGNRTADFSIVGREYIRLGDRVIAIENTPE